MQITRVQHSQICLRCKCYLGINPRTGRSCGCPDYLIPEFVVIHQGYVYRECWITEEGQIEFAVCLGTVKELGLEYV